MRRLSRFGVWLTVAWLVCATTAQAAQPSPLGTAASASTTSFDAGAGNYTAFTYAVGAGSDRILVLFLITGDNVQTGATGVTYGGQTMTAIPGFQKDDANWVAVQGFYLLEAGIAAASNTTFSVDFVTSTIVDEIIVGAAAYSGASQTTPFPTSATTATATSTAPSTGSITASADEIVIGAIATDDDNAIAQSSTLLFEVEGVSADLGGGAQSRTNTGALVWTTDNQPWAVAGIALAGAGGGGATPTPRLMLLGVGGF